jgi:hypothetical protein
MKESAQYIDMTPTWESLLPAMLMLIEQGKPAKAIADIKAELKRMAQAADKWNAHCDAQKKES